MKDKVTTSERLKQIMNEKNLRQVDILNRAEPYCKKYGVKLNRNDLSQYVSGKVEPGQFKLSMLGLALNVSEAWLMGYDVPQEREKPTAAELSDDEQILKVIEALTPDNKKKILELAKLYAAGQDEN
ncbi:transcriptional regulator [Caproicibacterium amylolyticum]|uniref:Transcriptional regulator n=1 Tax=Caproicibacterium amylolyticum TaxID=2766537 RepID=A0A7G9WF64_9FIRM|nr:transcriptional regulator [Caproicibacterium amylolyticum]QNO17326.1 transcriptional regulator [Caproicibacterium amylolyticum]